MSIRALSIREPDRFNEARTTVARHIDHAVEWFADDGGAVLGAIAYHHFTLEWSLVVLQRDRGGEFRACGCDAGLRVLADVRRILVERMALAAADWSSSHRAAA
jgi:hypothetical protein